MFKKSFVMIVVFVILASLASLVSLVSLAACSGTPPTPETVVETVVVIETVEVEVEKEVEKVVTQEVIVEKVVTVEVEKEVVVVETVEVEVEKEVPVIETVEVEKVVEVQVTPTLTPEPTADPTNPTVREVLTQVAFVQHTYNSELGRDEFVCVSEGLGLTGAQESPITAAADGSIFIGPNDGDFSLWGANGLFEIDTNGKTLFVPQQTGGQFVDPDGTIYESFSQQEALGFFTSGDMIWTGKIGAAGRIAECDPSYVEDPDEEEEESN